MKGKIIAVAIFIGFLGPQLMAQNPDKGMDNKTQKQISEKVTLRLTQKLGLTSTQAQSVEAILLESFTRRQVVKTAHPELAKLRGELKLLKEDGKNEMEAILTEPQLAQLKANRKKMKQNKLKGAHSGSKDVSNRILKMKSELGLTDNQAQELEVLFTRMKVKREAIKANYPELDKMQKDMKNIKYDTDIQMKKVLSAEQYAMYLKKGRSHGGQ